MNNTELVTCIECMVMIDTYLDQISFDLGMSLELFKIFGDHPQGTLHDGILFINYSKNGCN